MSVTDWFLIFTVVAIIGFDLFAYLKWGNPGTISVVLYDIARAYPWIALALGFVMGHIFWQVHICEP